MASPVRSTEYAIRIRRPIKDKQYSVLTFNESAMLNLADWKNANFSVHMRREGSEKQAAATEPRQSYGVGSEFGSAARQEARRKKYGRQMQKFHIDTQPLQLSIRYENGKERKFRGVRGSGMGEHADYWVLLRQVGRIEAVKVNGWSRLFPTANLSLDEEALQRNCGNVDRHTTLYGHRVLTDLDCVSLLSWLKDQQKESEVSVMTNNIRDGCSTGDECMEEDDCEEIRRILEDMIERKLQLVDMSTIRDGQQHWHDTGIKLLSDSQQTIINEGIEAEDDSDNGPPKKQRKRKDSGSSDSEE